MASPVNENNVDLNRNFLEPHEKFAGAPEGYQMLDCFLNPATPPSSDLFYLRGGLLARYGMAALLQAIAGGQYVNPKGLFFGGACLEQGPTKLQAYLADHLAGVERIMAIDIHTGLGRFGDDQLLVDTASKRLAVNQKMRLMFGERVQLMDANGIAYEARGAQHGMYYGSFPRAQNLFCNAGVWHLPCNEGLSSAPGREIVGTTMAPGALTTQRSCGFVRSSLRPTKLGGKPFC